VNNSPVPITLSGVAAASRGINVSIGGDLVCSTFVSIGAAATTGDGGTGGSLTVGYQETTPEIPLGKVGEPVPAASTISST
jgi:hypothetical protein